MQTHVKLPGIGALRTDPAFWVAAAGFGAVILPYFLPWVSDDWIWYWGNRYADIPLYALALFATLAGLGRVESRRELRFWKLIAFALVALLVAELVQVVTPETIWPQYWDLVAQCVFLLFYLGMALAIQASRSEVTGQDAWKLHWLRTIGTGVFLIGLLVYFEALPSALTPAADGPWYVALLVFVALDLGLVAGSLKARSETLDTRWRNILGGVALVMGTWAVVDFAEAALYLLPPSMVELSPLWDLLWYVPIGLLIGLARMSIAGSRTEPESPVVLRHTSVGGGPLFVYALAVPPMHYLCYALGVLDPALREPREGVAVALLVALGVLSLMYQRSVELQNKATNEALRAGTERYQSFLHTSAEGIYLLEFSAPIRIDDPVDVQIAQHYERAHMAEANDAMAKMYGFRQGSEFVGISLKELHGGDDDPTNLKMMRSFVASGYRLADDESSEVDKEGNRKYFKNSAVGVVEDGLLVRIWGTQVDITEKRLAEGAREMLEAQLRQAQKMETIGTLAGGIAHDFNNVLAPILGFAELAAEMTPPENREVRSHLDHVIRGTMRAQGMVSQILAVSRKQESERKPMLLQEVIADALELIRSTVPTTIGIATSIDTDCPAVFADSGQMHQVVMNLCTNASHAIGESAGEIRVELCHTDVTGTRAGPGLVPGGYAVLTVSDDGPGMDSDTADKVFEPFFTTKGVSGGTGLGLSVVHGIVSAHGGDIRLATGPGKGARFVVYLPTTDQPVAPVAVAAASPGGAALRVLVVDDEEEVASVVMAMLSSLGFAATSFLHSPTALEAFRADPEAYDLILTDHTMPNLTGSELARAARTIRPGIAVLVASGYRLAESPEYDGEFEQLGKPFTRSDLAKAVRRALGSADEVAVP